MNIPINLNIGYAYTHNRIFSRMPDIQFYYGEYGTNYVGLRKYANNVLTFPVPKVDRNSMANCPKDYDMLFMHDDPQRLLFARTVKAPRLLWLPLDHENQDPFGHHLIIREFDEVIPITKFAYESRDYWTRKWIYNPVETKIYRPVEVSKKKFGFKEDDFVAIYVGNSGWRKRISHLLIAAAKLKERIPNFKLFMVSDFMHDNGFNYMELIRGLGLSETVFFPRDISKTNPIPPVVLNEAYNIADVYVTTHGGEGMGIPIVEAMSAGKPFVATDYTTTKEFAGDGKRGLGAKIGSYIIDKGIKRPYVDIDDFVEKVVWLYENPDQRKKMGKAGREWAVKNCDADLVAGKLHKIFMEYAPVEVKLNEDNMGS